MKEYKTSEKRRIWLKEYRQIPEVNKKINKYAKEYKKRPEVKKRMKEYAKEYRKEYFKRDYVKKRVKEYYNRPEMKKRKLQRYKKWCKKKYYEDKEYNITIRLRSKVNRAFNNYIKTKKIWKSKEYGIDYKKIIKHLQPFPEDISLYHIDHIKPLSLFNFINSDDTINYEEIQKAFKPSNHQWMLIKDNIIKSNKF